MFHVKHLTLTAANQAELAAICAEGCARLAYHDDPTDANYATWHTADDALQEARWAYDEVLRQENDAKFARRQAWTVPQ